MPTTDTQTPTEQMFWVIDPSYTTTEDNDHALSEGGRVDPTATTVGYVDSPAVWETPMIQVTASELQDYYNSQPFLQQQFGSYENYLGYQTAYSEAYDNFVGDNWGWRDVPEDVRENQTAGYESFWGAADSEQSLEDYTAYLNTLEEMNGTGRVWTPEEAQLHMVSEHVASVPTNLGGIIGDINVGPVTMPDGTTVNVGPVSLSEMGYDSMEGAPDGGSTDSWAAQTPMELYNQFHNSAEIQALNQQYGIDPNASQRVVGEDGNLWSVSWNGNGFTAYQYQDVPNTPRAGDYIQAAAIAGLTAGAAAGIGAAVGGGAAGGVGGTAGSGASPFADVLREAASHGLGSAIVQGAVTGDVDLSQVAVAGITAGLGELADMAANGSLAASGDVGAAVDNFAWDLAEQLGTDINTVYDMAFGIAGGVVTGEDVEDIVLGAIGTYTTSEIQDYVRTAFGDQFGDIELDNWFDDGTTTIDVRAFDPFIETAVGGILGDDVTAEDALLALWEFGTYEGEPETFDQGGTLAFADPTRAELDGLLPDWDLPDIPLPDIPLPDIPLPDIDVPDIPLPDIPIPDIPWNVSVPDVPLPDVSLPDVSLPDIDLPEINLPEVDLPDIDPPEVDLPEVDLPEVDLPEVDLPEADPTEIETPEVDIDLPAMGAGMMSGGGYNFNPFLSGIDYQRVARPTVPIQTGADENTQYLNDLIARNLGGSLLSQV